MAKPPCFWQPTALTTIGIVPREGDPILRSGTPSSWSEVSSPTEQITLCPWQRPSAIRNESCSSCEKTQAWPGVSTRRAPVRCHMPLEKATPTLSNSCWTMALIQTCLKTWQPEGRALFETCCANHLPIAELLLKHGANPNAGSDSSGCCLTIAGVYHGAKAKPLQQLLRRHGAVTPPYAMSAQEMRRAIRCRHKAIEHEQFLSCVMAQRDAKLLDLYLDSDSAAVKRLQSVACPTSPTLARKLLARGLDPNRPDWLGSTFVHACARDANQSVAAVLLKAGADINARDFEFKGTPLAAAVRAWCAEKNPKLLGRRRRMVQFLLQQGAATNFPGDEPWATPLAWSTRHGPREIVETLKRHGAQE
jgi:hypothetical protein